MHLKCDARPTNGTNLKDEDVGNTTPADLSISLHLLLPLASILGKECRESAFKLYKFYMCRHGCRITVRYYISLTFFTRHRLSSGLLAANRATALLSTCYSHTPVYYRHPRLLFDSSHEPPLLLSLFFLILVPDVDWHSEMSVG